METAYCAGDTLRKVLLVVGGDTVQWFRRVGRLQPARAVAICGTELIIFQRWILTAELRLFWGRRWRERRWGQMLVYQRGRSSQDARLRGHGQRLLPGPSIFSRREYDEMKNSDDSLPKGNHFDKTKVRRQLQ